MQHTQPKKPLYTLDTYEDNSSVGSKESDGTKEKKFDRKIRKIEIANKEIERSNYDLMERYKFERDDIRKANEKLEDEEKEYTIELLKMAADLWGGISDKLQETICIKSGKDKATIIKHPEIFLPLVTECHRTRIKQPRVIKKIELKGRFTNHSQYHDETLSRYKERTEGLLQELKTADIKDIDEEAIAAKTLEGSNQTKFKELKDKFKEDIELPEDSEIDDILPKTIDLVFEV